MPRLRVPAVLLGSLLLLSGCATSEQWREWMAHPTHFASGDHATFSRRNQDAARPRVATADSGVAGRQSWWGDGVPDAPPADIAGRWTGIWSAPGLFGDPRGSHATVVFRQAGSGGEARLVLDDTNAAESIPMEVRLAGSQGVPLVLFVSGNRVVARNEAGNEIFTATLRVTGDRMVGYIEHGGAPILLRLARAPRG
jgi:hypothetical protein